MFHRNDVCYEIVQSLKDLDGRKEHNRGRNQKKSRVGKRCIDKYNWVEQIGRTLTIQTFEIRRLCTGFFV